MSITTTLVRDTKHQIFITPAIGTTKVKYYFSDCDCTAYILTFTWFVWHFSINLKVKKGKKYEVES